MKSMKKIIMLLLSAALVLSFAGTVSADGTEVQGSSDYGSSSSGAVPVTFSQEGAYIVQLPSSIALGEPGSYTAAGEIRVTKNDLGTSNLSVSVKSKNAWYVVHSENIDAKLSYFLDISNSLYGSDDYFTKQIGNGEKSTDSVNIFTTNETGKLTLMTYRYSAGETSQLGEYADELTFTFVVTHPIADMVPVDVKLDSLSDN